MIAPIHEAVKEGHLNVVKLLIDKGCDLELKDSFGKTALHYAVSNTNIDCLELLINAKVNLNAQKNDG